MTLANMSTGIVIISWLEPESIGIWNSLIIFQSYIFFIQLGVFNALNRELPFQFGKGLEENVKKYASTALWVNKVCALITLSIGIFVLFCFIFFYGNDFRYISAGFVVILISVTNFYQNYLQVTFRSSKSFDQLANIYFIQTTIIFLSLIFIYLYGFYGLLVRSLLVAISLIFLLHHYRPIRVTAKLERKSLNSLLKVGLPLFSMGYLQGLTNTFPRLILLILGGVLSVGLFSPALAIISAMKVMPSVVGQYIYPQMSFDWGKHGQKERLWQMTWKSNFYLLIFLLPIGIGGYFLLPWVVREFFPKYMEGLYPAQITSLSSAFIGSLVGINVLNSIKAWNSLIILTILKLILFGGTLCIFAILMNPLLGVAYGLLIASVLYFFSANVICYYELIIKK